MTTTNASLCRLKEVIDEYVDLGLHSVFIRGLKPFGRAKNNEELHYSSDKYVEKYLEVLEYIFELNQKGVFFVEEFASILLSKILTPFSTSFVDMQSPGGAGISGVIYGHDGKVYASDEGRMLSYDGDEHLKIGDVHEDTFEEIFSGDPLKNIVQDSIIESQPECAWCVYQPYCGSDAVRNYSLYGDMVSFKPSDAFCKRNKEVFNYIFNKLKQNDLIFKKTAWSWITGDTANLDLVKS